MHQKKLKQNAHPDLIKGQKYDTITITSWGDFFKKYFYIYWDIFTQTKQQTNERTKEN